MGDFNIHVCCLENPLAKEFLSLIDSFDLVQFVNAPTHIQGHTLDLVLSHGLTVSDLVIEDHVISDHKPIVFRVPTAFHITRPTLRLFDCLVKSHRLPLLSFQLFLMMCPNHLAYFVIIGVVQILLIILIPFRLKF